MIRFRLLTFFLPFSLSFFFLLCSGKTSEQKSLSEAASGKDSVSTLTLLFAGDVMQHGPQIEGAHDLRTDTYNYDSCFRFIKPIVSGADYAVANLETTLAGAPYTGYPMFSAPDGLADGLKNAGFDLLITANNHALDKGKEGLERTIEVLHTKGFVHTGTFRDSSERAASYPLLVEVKNFKLAFLNCTYGTNGMPVYEPNKINLIDTVEIKADLDKALAQHPDAVIVTLHWGNEYERTESNEQRKVADFLFRNGADLVIGSHPHVVQPVELLKKDKKGRVVYYSLGNYVSNQRDRYKDGGIMAVAELTKKSGKHPKITVSDAGYIPVWVYKKPEDGKHTYHIIPVSLYEKDSTLMDLGAADREALQRFAEDTREHLKNVREIKP